MAKSTFFNLPAEKRQHIFHQALAEFARHPYEQASLSEIVSSAGIAKGSMYQYFAGKKDLYNFVLNQVYQHKREYLQSVWAQRDDLDFFGLISLYYKQSWHFAREFPEYHRVTVNFWDSRDATLREEILREKQVRITEFTDLLEQGCQTGVLSPDIDKEAAYFAYHGVARALIDNFLSPDVNTESHEAFINSVLAILEQGLRPRKEHTQCQK